MLSVWEERKVRLYGEHANVHQSHSQNDSGDLRGVAGGDGELGCLCGKAGTGYLCDGSAHSPGCVVNGYGCLFSYKTLIEKGVRKITYTDSHKTYTLGPLIVVHIKQQSLQLYISMKYTTSTKGVCSESSYGVGLEGLDFTGE